MDFFQGSSPPNFISFFLENQNIDEAQTPTNTVENNLTQSDQTLGQLPDSAANLGLGPLPPLLPHIRAVTFQDQNMTESPLSTDSNVDVTAYATEMVQRMEATQIAVSPPVVRTDVDRLAEAPNTEGLCTPPPVDPRKTSTPKQVSQNPGEPPSLSQLESLLQIAPTASSGFPELQVGIGTSREVPGVSSLQGEEDSSSTISGPPPLPKGKTREAELTSDIDTTGAASGFDDFPPLYGAFPGCSELESEKGSDTELDDYINNPLRTPTVGASQQEEPLRELSGRSRAILKQYFDTEDPYTFPVGHRTVAFTEPQIYHLLRVLTDEAINMTCTTMEQMVIGAVRGKPATAPSRTGQFRSRAQSPRPQQVGSTSSEGFITDPGQDSEASGDFSALLETGGISMLDDTDSSGEMALIADSFRKTSNKDVRPEQHSSIPLEPVGRGDESTRQSSLDAILSEVREQSSTQKSRSRRLIKKVTKAKTTQRRGVPMREEFFSKIGWTRSFISGPADPLHNPHMVWCHMCKKNFSMKTKGVVEILRHHRTEKHLRKDQRWRYEHLKTVDPITGKVQHRVRGRNGKILSKVELAQELPKFIHTELVDVGERFPFYEDYLKGSTTALVTPQSRTKTQICLIGDFIQRQGDLTVLRNLWSRVGSFTDYQAAFHDFDWSEERITVSITCVSCSLSSHMLAY